MSRWTLWIDLALAAAAAYSRNQRRRQTHLAATGALLLLSAAALFTAMGLGLAAAYHGMMVLGPARAALLTAAIALAVAVAAGMAVWILASTKPPQKP